MNGLVVPENLNPQSDQFKALVAGLLGRMDPNSDGFREMIAGQMDRIDNTRPVGTKFCDSTMRLWPTSAFEAMLFRKGKSGTAEVYLRRRAPDDTAYPGEWHAPGSLYRHGEQDQHVANRLGKEFGAEISGFTLVGKEITSEARGTVHSMIFLIALKSDPRVDDRHGWFPVDHLPEVTVDLHRDLIIPKAYKALLSTWR
ncbi:MAG TPA: hypothetical protein VLK22_02395 [Candidatus Udaeobacter sp.]|nr:hypothetical protein [Candidatus Udaeobacter sp.]